MAISGHTSSCLSSLHALWGLFLFLGGLSPIVIASYDLSYSLYLLTTNAIALGAQNSMHIFGKQEIESVISPSMWNAVYYFFYVVLFFIC